MDRPADQLQQSRMALGGVKLVSWRFAMPGLANLRVKLSLLLLSKGTGHGGKAMHRRWFNRGESVNIRVKALQH